jgi:hypothetical protein
MWTAAPPELSDPLLRDGGTGVAAVIEHDRGPAARHHVGDVGEGLLYGLEGALEELFFVVHREDDADRLGPRLWNG